MSKFTVEFVETPFPSMIVMVAEYTLLLFNVAVTVSFVLGPVTVSPLPGVNVWKKDVPVAMDVVFSDTLTLVMVAGDEAVNDNCAAG